MSKAISSDEMPARLANAIEGLEWAVHPNLSGFDERPGSMLIASIWFENGRSATLVYGCSLHAMPWNEQVSGPWPTSIGVASRLGDEGRLCMSAAFNSKAARPVAAGTEVVFDGDGGCVELGDLTAIIETRSVSDALKAVRTIQSMPSAWDDARQQVLWGLVRAGNWVELEKELRISPQWAQRAWSKGSSLQALCLRLGDWKSLSAVVRVAAQAQDKRDAELAAECSRALASFCKEACPHWPLGAAPRALAKAWGAGAKLDLGKWSASFGPSSSAKRAAREAWALGEALAIGEDCTRSECSSTRSL
jgi:hypothetical protein